MGIFGSKKGNQKKGFDILSSNGLIDYFKKNLGNPTDEELVEVVQAFAAPDKDQEHLTADGILPWGWYTLHKDFTNKIESEHNYFWNCWNESKDLSPKEQYQALRDYVKYMNDAKRLCYSKGECFAYWYDGLAKPAHIDKRTKELEELEANLEELQHNYVTRQKELKELDKRVYKSIVENEGILQSEFFKLFHPLVKHDVSHLLYAWDKEGKITRIKSGKSYKLYAKK